MLSHFIMLWILLFITSVHMRWTHLSTQHTDVNLGSWLLELANEPSMGPGTYIVYTLWTLGIWVINGLWEG